VRAKLVVVAGARPLVVPMVAAVIGVVVVWFVEAVFDGSATAAAAVAKTLVGLGAAAVAPDRDSSSV